MVFTERLLASTITAMSIKVIGWQLRAEETWEHDSAIKGTDVLKFIGQVTLLRALLLCQTMRVVSAKDY